MEWVLNHYGYSLTYWTDQSKPTNSESFWLLCLSTILMKFGMWTTPTLLLSCSFHAPALLLPYSSPAPASAQPLPYSCPASFKLLSGTFLAPPQFLPSSCPLSALLCFTLLSSAQLCSCPVPTLLLPCSSFCPALALLLPCFCPARGPAHPSLAAFIIIISTLWLFSARREPPFMVLKLRRRTTRILIFDWYQSMLFIWFYCICKLVEFLIVYPFAVILKK